MTDWPDSPDTLDEEMARGAAQRGGAASMPARDEPFDKAARSEGTPAAEADTPEIRCRIGHCVEMPHMAFVDWQAPTDDGVRSGLFTVNLTSPVNLMVESHPSSTTLRRLSVTCGSEHIATIDVLRSAAMALNTDIWDSLSTARANYAAHAKRYRKARQARSEQVALGGEKTDASAPSRLPSEAAAASSEPASGERTEADASTPAAPPSSGRSGRRMSPTTRAVLIGLLGYVLLTAAGFGGYSLYAGNMGLATTAPLVPENDAPTAQGNADGRETPTKWQPE